MRGCGPHCLDATFEAKGGWHCPCDQCHGAKALTEYLDRQQAGGGTA